MLSLKVLAVAMFELTGGTARAGGITDNLLVPVFLLVDVTGLPACLNWPGRVLGLDHLAKQSKRLSHIVS